MSKKLRIEDLVGAVQEDAEIAEIENVKKNTNNTSKEQIDKLDNTLKKMKLKKIEVSQKVSQKQTAKLERQENNLYIKSDMKKWLPAIKKNREAEHLDFTENVKNDEFRMQTNANSKKNDKSKAASAQDKIMQKLQEINIDNEDNLKKREYKQIEKLDSEKRDDKLGELVQHRNLTQYKEQKFKRMKKIKSKLYRKIKKKAKSKEETTKLEMMQDQDPKLRWEHFEKLEKDRARERVLQKHKNTSKYIKGLKKFADEKQSQNAMNDRQAEKKKLQRKLNMSEYKELLDESSNDEAWDKDYKGAAIDELEKEFLGIDENQKDEKDMDVIDKLINVGKNNLKKEAKNLISKLKRGDEDIKDDLGEDLYDSDLSDDEDVKLTKKQKLEKLREAKLKLEQSKSVKDTGRKKFKTDAVIVENDVDANYMGKGNQTAKNILKNYNDNQDTSDNLIDGNIVVQEDNKQKESTTIVNPKKKINTKPNDLSENLLEGVDLAKIKKKYHKGESQNFDIRDIEQFMDENDDDAYKQIDNDNIDYNVFDDANEQEFADKKQAEIEDQVEEEPKAMVGWGDWAGPGVTEKKPTEAQIQRQNQKKIDQIESIRAKRKDKNQDNVILHEERNKLIKKYLVDDLPLNVKSADQFDYLNSKPLSSEWNGLLHQDRLTKPQVKTRAGEIINPINYSLKKTKR